ncbi:glycosyltransferase family 2 protein [Owenweeksia hongkongensis]|uniref:glycosyltransferase family 2 protein n=1 Tax=Owenweeksia hongkongensis TaxID=253245 RepID=UPI003A943865
MNQGLTLTFWLLLFLIFYTYIGYGILLFIIVKLKRLVKNKKEERFDYEPEVTLVIPAFNEEHYIEDKALNSLGLDYPKSKLRILFITDGSTDGTREILEEIDGVEVVHEDRRGGKSAAENRAMKYVQTPIVIFCDANTELNRESVRELVKHYADAKVGGVSGEKRISMKSQSNASGAGEGMYWKYESFLKKLDSELLTIVGAAGELVSFRTELVEDLEEDTILDDFIQSLRICEKGYRMVYEPKAYAVEMSSENVKEELKRKIRIAAGGWQAMYRLRHLLNPFKDFVFTFQYISHRVLRWSISAISLPMIFLLNFLLIYNEPISSNVYHILFLAQVSFYLLAIIGWYLESKNLRIKALFVPYYFTMMNYAVLVGFSRWLKGKQRATWEKSARMKVENNQTL